VLESHRSGRGALGKLEVIAGGADAGRLNPVGSLLVPTGNSIALMAFEVANRVHDFTAQGTVTMTVWPRSRWEPD
jgi:hypothetical protein